MAQHSNEPGPRRHRGRFPPGVSGNPGGRPKGGASLRRELIALVTAHPTLVGEAWRRGLEAPPPKSFPYVQLAAYYLDGKPVERVEVQRARAIRLFPIGARTDPTDPTGERVIGPDGRELQPLPTPDDDERPVPRPLPRSRVPGT